MSERIIEWIFLTVVAVGIAYSYYRGKSKREEFERAKCRKDYDEFIKIQESKWRLFYAKHKIDDGLSNEEIVSRYVFCMIDYWYQTGRSLIYVGIRNDILGAIISAGPLSEQEIWTLAAKIDREGAETRLVVRFRKEAQAREALVEEMHSLIVGHMARSRLAAARMVAGDGSKVAGLGDLESKIRCLVDDYKEKYGPEVWRQSGEYIQLK